MDKKTKKLLLALTLFFLFVNFTPALAANCLDCSGSLVCCGGTGQTACTVDELFCTLGRVIDYVLDYIVPALAIFGVVWAAIIMMTSNGDPAKFAQGKQAIITIGIGLVIIYLSWAIVKSFIQFLGGQAWTLKFFQ
jgi:hypothetical protein